MPSISQRLAAVQSPVIPVVAGLIRDHPGTISLGQGVVSYGPPPAIEEGIRQCLADAENHKYKLVDGIPPLRELIARKLAAENGITLSPDNALVVTAGGNMAFLNALLAIADPGDEVILQTPFYFNHEMAIVMANCRPVLVPTDANCQLQLDRIRDAITPRTRAVVTVSPNNPTGAVYPEAALREVNRMCLAAGIYHIHDEAYEYFTHDGARHFSPGSNAGSAGHTIALYSLSKAYGFASWRIGYQVIPTGLLEAVKKIQDTNLICPPVISQFAAVGALTAGRSWCERHLEPLRRVRSSVARELESIRDLTDIPPAAGAFYFFVKVKTSLTPMALVTRLVSEHGVAVIPGDAFGFTDGCAVRISYGALTPATASEGLRRFTKGLRAIVAGGG